VPKPSEAFTYWEFDIKFIYIHHLGRYAPMLSVVDVYSRYLIGWMMQWSIKKEDVVGFLMLCCKIIQCQAKFTSDATTVLSLKAIW